MRFLYFPSFHQQGHAASLTDFQDKEQQREGAREGEERERGGGEREGESSGGGHIGSMHVVTK